MSYDKIGILTDALSMANLYGSRDLVDKLDLELKQERNRILLEESRERIDASGLFEFVGNDIDRHGRCMPMYMLKQAVGIHPAGKILAGTIVTQETALELLGNQPETKRGTCE